MHTAAHGNKHQNLIFQSCIPLADLVNKEKLKRQLIKKRVRRWKVFPCFFVWANFPCYYYLEHMTAQPGTARLPRTGVERIPLSSSSQHNNISSGRQRLLSDPGKITDLPSRSNSMSLNHPQCDNTATLFSIISVFAFYTPAVSLKTLYIFVNYLKVNF